MSMIVNYLKVAWRNTIRNPVYSFINVAGLSSGMAVVILIGAWIYDGISFDKYHLNYDRLARVMVNHNFNGEVSTMTAQPFPLGQELRDKYSADFEEVAMTSWSYGHFLQFGEKKLSAEGMFTEAAFIRMFSLNMIAGGTESLRHPNSIALSASLAKNLFGDGDPIGKIMTVDNYMTVTVTGVYEDLPANSTFSSTRYLLPWELYAIGNEWVRDVRYNWDNSSFQTLVLLKPFADMSAVSEKISDVIRAHSPESESKPALLLHPMSRWHLYGHFENGMNTGGDIQFVWLFGIIGAFVLLLACINFMNLSTARSERRAKEVGLRKVIGSGRVHLVQQFLGESLMYSIAAFVLSLILAQLSMPIFNELAGKDLDLPVDSVVFWIMGFSFSIITGLLAGTYPALFLSSFRPIHILKGTFFNDRSSTLPRKILVVAQFTISITLIIGTVVVYRQIMHAKDRSIGYDWNGLVTTYGYPISDPSNNPTSYDGLRAKVLQTGAVTAIGKSSTPTTNAFSNQVDFEWEGKDPAVIPYFAIVWCSHDYGSTIGLEVIQGRDFSRDFASDTAAVVINEAAADFIGFTGMIGRQIRYENRDLTVIGVVKNVLMESPYEPVRPTVYMVDYNEAQILTLRLNPEMNARESLAKVEEVFKQFRPAILFEYQFVDDEFNRKFANEERIGKLASVFASLAIFISCLGIFGLASFMAERRTKEIGIRKILGASLFRLWKLLSGDYVTLVVVSCVIAMPISFYSLEQWLQRYAYRTEVSLSIYIFTSALVLLLTLIIVSFQTIKTAMSNPVDSLRSE